MQAKTKTIQLVPFQFDEETVRLIENHDLTLEDLRLAICLKLRKFGLCQLPCPLSNLVVPSELREPLKSE